MQSGKPEKPKFLALPKGAHKKATFPGADVRAPARSDRAGFNSARAYVPPTAPINPDMQPAIGLLASIAANYSQRISFNGNRAQISDASPRSTSTSAAVTSVNYILPALVAPDSPENGEQPPAAGQKNVQPDQKTISASASISAAQPALPIKIFLVKEESNSPQNSSGSFVEKANQNQTTVENMLSRLKCCWFTKPDKVYDLRVTAPNNTQKPISTIK